MLEVDLNNQAKWEVKDGQNGQVKIETFTFPQADSKRSGQTLGNWKPMRDDGSSRLLHVNQHVYEITITGRFETLSK
jgi:hypothetical protein